MSATANKTNVTTNANALPALPAATAVQMVRDASAGSIIDVRTPLEHRHEHIAGSRSVPLDQIAARIDEIRATPGPRLLLCRSGKRADAACQQLAAAGVTDVTVIEGGIEAYRAAGGTTVVARTGMSLERQVRIAAGLLVVLGGTLGFTVHPALHLLSAFVGAGLVFAGITDRCGMALILARLPWNRGAAAAGPSCTA